MTIVKNYEKDGQSYPTIELKSGEASKFGFTFGVGKARMILENYEDIRQFVQDNSAVPA